MEPTGAIAIFNLPEETHKSQYINYISDGDTKSFKMVQEKNPCKDKRIVKNNALDIHKNVAHKIAYLFLMWQNKVIDGKTIGRKGRLSKTCIDTLQNSIWPNH